MPTRLNIILGLIASLGLAVGLATQVVFLALFGAGTVTDAFVAAQVVPLLLYSVLGIALLSVWQPVLAVATGHERRRGASLALGQATLLLAPLTLVAALTVRLWAPLLFPGFDGEALRLTILLSPVIMLTLLFNGGLAILSGVARAEGRFVAAETAPAVMGLMALAALLPAIRWGGVEGAAWLLVGRAAGAFFIVWLLLGRPMPSFARDPLKTQALARARPILAASSLYKLTPLFDRFLASQAGAGGVALFNLAQTGGSAVSTVVERAGAAPAAPGLARNWANADYRAFRTDLRRTMALTWLPVLALAILLAAAWPVWERLSSPALNITPDQAALLYGLCAGLLGMIGAGASGAVVVAGFYAAGDTRTPTLVGSAGFVVSLAVKFVMFDGFGLIGLAWAVSIYYVVNLLALWLLLERKVARAAGRS